MPTDIAYADADPAGGRGHLLDVYLPVGTDAGRTGGPRPLLVWSSGSAWLSDDGRSGAGPAADHFTASGWVVAGVSVRSSAQATFPGPLHDGKAAVRWLRAHADEFGIDTIRIAIMGNSSGGWLASMVALTGDRADLEGDVGGVPGRSHVRAAVDLYGPSDFDQMDAHMGPAALAEFNGLLGIAGGHGDPGSPESRLVGAPIAEVPERVRTANPAAYASSFAPPVLLVHGQADPLVPHHQSALLYDALAAAGAHATFVSIPGNRHEHPYVHDPSASAGRIVTSTRPGGPDVDALRAEGPTWRAIELFLRRALGWRGPTAG